jgi:hypothetical protein
MEWHKTLAALITLQLIFFGMLTMIILPAQVILISFSLGKCVTILASERNRRDGKILINSFQKEQKQELLLIIITKFQDVWKGKSRRVKLLHYHGSLKTHIQTFRLPSQIDLYLYCQVNNIDFTKLRAALNTKWNVNVPDLEGGIGHPIKRDDSKMLMSYSSKLSGSKIINAIFNVDHEYRKSKKITDDDIH